MSGLEELTICACKSRESGQTIYGIRMFCCRICNRGNMHQCCRHWRCSTCRKAGPAGCCSRDPRCALRLHLCLRQTFAHIQLPGTQESGSVSAMFMSFECVIYTAISIRKCCSNFKDKQDLHTTRRPLHTVLHQRRQCSKAPSMSELVAANVRARAPSSAVCPTTGPVPFCSYASDAERHSTAIPQARSG